MKNNISIISNKGFTLVELLIVVSILATLLAIAVPTYLGQQKRAARAEALSNLQNLRLLEEQFFADNGVYTIDLGTCAADNPDNIDAIQTGNGDPNNALRGFKPGNDTSYSYCVEQNINLDGNAQTPCFRASAFGNTGTRVAGDIFMIDCNNNRNF